MQHSRILGRPARVRRIDAGSSWYVRRGKQTKGPFPEAMLRERLHGGGLHDSDEVSHDMRSWQRAGVVWGAFELDDEGPRASRPNVDSSPSRATRSAVPGLFARQAARLHRAERLRALALLAVGVGLAGLAAAGIALTPPPTESASCATSPGPGVDWSNCAMQGRILGGVDLAGARLRNARLAGADLLGARLVGADLAYADLAGARLAYSELVAVDLTGADLRGADLSYARLEDANLAYADLTGANIGGAALHGARLDRAIWVDASRCLVGSLGACRVARE